MNALRLVATDGQPLDDLDSVPAPLYTPTEHLMHVADVLREVLSLYKDQDLSQMTHGDAYAIVEHANRYAQCTSYTLAFQKRNWGCDYREGYDGDDARLGLRVSADCVGAGEDLPYVELCISPETHHIARFMQAVADDAEMDLQGWLDGVSGNPTRDTQSAFGGSELTICGPPTAS